MTAVVQHIKVPTVSKTGNEMKNGLDMSLYRWEPKQMQEAYKELSHKAFAVWVRLMAVSDQTLRGGWRVFMTFVRLQDVPCRRIVAELVAKGYMLVKNNGPGRPARFIIKKRCRIKGKSTFVRI